MSHIPSEVSTAMKLMLVLCHHHLTPSIAMSGAEEAGYCTQSSLEMPLYPIQGEGEAREVRGEPKGDDGTTPTRPVTVHVYLLMPVLILHTYLYE